MSTIKVALVQLEIQMGQPEVNLERAAVFVEQAKERGAQLVVLPELWPTGYDLERAGQHASQINEGIFEEIAGLARKFEVYVCGSALENEGGRYFNTQTVYAPDGKLEASYRKIHLFGLMREPDFLAPGERLSMAELPWGKAGLAICYDLRFPEIFRRYALDGAQMIILSAEWPHPRLEHWRTLIRARAIENQCFIVACNSVGEGNGNIFFGHSMVVNPWGETLYEADETETVMMAELDLAHVNETRTRFPFFNDRRTGLYSLS